MNIVSIRDFFNKRKRIKQMKKDFKIGVKLYEEGNYFTAFDYFNNAKDLYFDAYDYMHFCYPDVRDKAIECFNEEKYEEGMELYNKLDLKNKQGCYPVIYNCAVKLYETTEGREIAKKLFWNCLPTNYEESMKYQKIIFEEMEAKKS